MAWAKRPLLIKPGARHLWRHARFVSISARRACIARKWGLDRSFQGEFANKLA